MIRHHDNPRQNGTVRKVVVSAARALPILCAIILAAEGSPWSEMVDSDLKNIPDPPPVQDLIRLATYAGVESDEPLDREARARVQEHLRTVPKLGEQLASHLRQERENWLSGRAVSSNGYNTERSHVLGVMGNLPDPNVVKALGEFLTDLEWPGYQDGLEAVMNACPPPNGVLASSALGRLIENPPLQKSWEEYGSDDVKTWELWFAQVKAGNRTFRFKGDPQEYNLQGPVSKAAEPTASRPRKAGHPVATASAVKKESVLPMISLVAGCGLLGVAVWILRKRSV